MPRFVGRPARVESTHMSSSHVKEAELVNLTWSQQCLLPARAVVYYMDCSDRGGPRRRAKRWNRWFTSRDIIANSPRTTRAMMDRAGLLGPVKGR